jgi:putative transposase
VVYHSKPSYYDLLKEGRLSWHQTQAANPNRDEAPVWRTREEIKKQRAARQADIVSGEVMVLVEDECHLVWGDAIGYGWGRRNERTEVPRANVNQRQTYDGVMNRYNQEFILSP